MATYSNILAWEITWTEEPGRAPWGHKESNTTEWLNNNKNKRIHQAALPPPTRRALRGAAPSRRFYRKKDGTRELLAQKSFPSSSVGKESAFDAGDLGSTPGSGRSPGEGIGYPLQYSWASLVAQTVKNLPAMQEAWVQSWVGNIPLEKGTATHYIILAWRISWKEEPGGLQSMGSRRVEQDWATFISNS